MSMALTAAPIGASSASSASSSVSLPFENTYARLPERFFARMPLNPVTQPKLIKLNVALAERLRMDPTALASPAGVEVLAGNLVAGRSEPIAQAYAGHQFGHFVPQLGDGRAMLLGEVVGTDGVRYDVQLKGSGRTAFSRGGDGRAALGPVLREYVVSEAMAALGVPTTRALAAVTTGEQVYRETVLPGAVLTRVAQSHVRIGTFQYFAARGDVDGVRILTDYAIARHYPEISGAEKRYQAFLSALISRQARLVADWMLLGFLHGVMNTDNTSISGETIDYGPCAFMEAYDPQTVFSSIDRNGRYAYGNQPRAAQWNLARFAETILPLLLEEAGSEEATVEFANSALAGFDEVFQAAHLAGWRRKLGLAMERDEDGALVANLLTRMEANEADFTSTLRRLCDAAADPQADAAVRANFVDGSAFDEWAVTWRHRLAEESVEPEQRAAAMRNVNPAYIPRNHQVQAVLDAAIGKGDFAPFERLLEVVTEPYVERPGLEAFLTPAPPDECVTQTFCGT